MIARRVEHHLVDDYVFVPCRVIAMPLRILVHGEPFVATVRKRLHRALAFGTVEQLRLQHRIAIEQVNRHLTSRLEVHRDNVPAVARYLTK